MPCSSRSASSGSLDENEREWLLALVTQCGQALERSRLLEDEQRLRRRSERLQSMTAALSGSLTRNDVAEVAVEEIADAVDADGVAIAVVAEEGQAVRTLVSRGYPPEVLEQWREIRLDEPTPANRALRRRHSSFYGSLDEIEDEFGGTHASLAATGHRAFLFEPLVAGRHADGLVTISWAEPPNLSRDDRTFLETLASQVAQALDRARHFESERTIAETLQRALLPESLPQLDGVDLAARYLPARPSSTSAATGSTRSSSATVASGSSSGTSSARASRPRRRWVSSGTRCGRSPSTR